MKFPPIRMNWRTAALIIVNALLVMTLGGRLWNGTETDRILHVTGAQMKVPVLRLELPALYSDFTGLTNRTPFYASRRLYELPAKPERPPPPLPKYVFGGALIRPHGPGVALLNDPANGNALRVIAGKDLDGWRVESVEASRVVLGFEDQHAEIAKLTKQPGQSIATNGVSRAPVINRAPRAGGVRVLGEGQTVSRRTPDAPTLPPLAGSGSEGVYIPAPPR